MAVMHCSYYYSSLSLFFCLTVFLRFLSVNSGHYPPLAPALYVFGDSLFDSGNNNYLPTLAKANYAPYGVNFPEGVTGRFTDGRTIPDIIAEYLRLPYPPPAISNPTPVPRTGLNYASGVCGILPETGKIFGKCLTLDDQIKLFQTTAEATLTNYFGSKEELSDYLSKSIFTFAIGNNDYLMNYLLPAFLYNSSKVYNPQQFSKLLISKLSEALKSLYKLGARKVIVFELGPIGCLPYTTNKGRCDEGKNNLVAYFNNDLGLMLAELTSTLNSSTFVVGRVNSLGYSMIHNPLNYGLKDGTSSCCNSWLNGRLTCIPLVKPCPDKKSHFFWDAFHFTEAASVFLVNACIHNSSICHPVNLEGLVVGLRF